MSLLISIFTSEYLIAQSIASLSMNSKEQGFNPALNMADTASHADSADLKGTNKVIDFFGNGISLNTTFVIIPNVPSLPIINWVKL